MKLYKIWQKLGKQPISITSYQDADVYVGDDQWCSGSKYSRINEYLRGTNRRKVSLMVQQCGLNSYPLREPNSSVSRSEQPSNRKD